MFSTECSQTKSIFYHIQANCTGEEMLRKGETGTTSMPGTGTEYDAHSASVHSKF